MTTWQVGNRVYRMFCLLILLASCAASRDPYGVAASRGESECGRPTLQEVREWFAGATKVSLMPNHGTQISYHATDGTGYLWYPGNVRVVTGNWKVRETEKTVEICYRYGPNTYNPFGPQSGGNWNCDAYIGATFFSVDWRKGDSFQLTKAERVPFVMARDEVEPFLSTSEPVYPSKCSPVRTGPNSPIDGLLTTVNNLTEQDKSERLGSNKRLPPYNDFLKYLN